MAKDLEINLSDDGKKKETKELEIDITSSEKVEKEVISEPIEEDIEEPGGEEEETEEEKEEETIDESKLYNNEFVTSPEKTDEDKEEIKTIMNKRRNRPYDPNRRITTISALNKKTDEIDVKVKNNRASSKYEEFKKEVDETTTDEPKEEVKKDIPKKDNIKEDNGMKKNLDINLTEEKDRLKKEENDVSFPDLVEEEEIEEEEMEEEVEEIEVEVERVEEVKDNTEEKSKEDAKNDAKDFVAGLLNFIKGGNFKKKIAEKSKETGLSERTLADSFFKKVLGTLSDVLHLAIDTVGDLYSTTICLLSGLLLSTGDLIIRCAKRLVRIVTLNSTCKA